MPKYRLLPINNSPALTDYTTVQQVSTSRVQPERTLWQKIYDLFVSSGMSEMTVASGIIAAGTMQGDATEITKTRNRVDTVPTGSGVVEDATNPVTRTVQNNCGTGEDLLWYPNGTDQFYGTGGTGLLGAGVPITIADGNSAAYVRYSTGVLTLQG